jgi:ubiquinone/menaquinone biosynthesis C-methylase UbiE
MVQSYTHLQAWLHDTLIADRALQLHTYILDVTGLADVLAEPIERQLLDVGCGGGQAAIMLKERYPQLELTGIDLSDFMIRRARRNADWAGLSILFKAANAQSPPFPDASFDVVYSFGSAKHWPDPARGLSECWRVLKSGGHLLISDATSDARLNEIENFYDIAGMPSLLKKPASILLDKRMFKPAFSIETYRRFAAQVGLPAGAVGQLPSMPAFLIHTRKPAG